MAKRLFGEKTIQDVLKAFVQVNKLEHGIEKVEVREAWFRIMGKGVANYTEEVLLKNDTLYVKISSSVLREELSYGKEKIIKMINDDLKREVLKKVVLR